MEKLGDPMKEMEMKKEKENIDDPERLDRLTFSFPFLFSLIKFGIQIQP